MKFMVMVRATHETETESNPAGDDPAARAELVREMMSYNEALTKAGVMKGGDGLQPSRKGARVVFAGQDRTVIDGPFAETKELIAGYWLWECASLQEAIDWARKCPNPTGHDSVLEIREVYEAEDFGEDLAPEIREREARMRAQIDAR
jgi:hypothetical protein